MSPDESDGDRTDAGLESPRTPFDESEFFRQLVANTSEGLLTIDTESTIIFANPAIEDILGYSPDELIGSSKMQLIPERLRQAHAAGLEKFLRTGDKHIDWDGIELPALHKDGHEVPVLISLREHRLNGQRVFTGLFRDISEQKYRERRFEAVFDNTYQLTGLLEPDGTLIEANEAALSFAGREREDVVGKPIWETFWFKSNEKVRQTAKYGVERAESGEFFRTEVPVQGADRTAIIDFSLRPMVDHQDDLRLLIAEGRDITDLKTREQHLQLLHRLLRHNLRNNLNIISGFAETLAEALDDPEHRQFAADIAKTADDLIEMNETAKELADATLGQERPQQPVALRDVLSDVVDESRERYPESVISIEREHLGGIVSADRRLRTVLAELVENAIKHANESRPTVGISIVTGDETIGVRIRDDGPPIPEAERTGIFNAEQVTQTNHGNGLGLWLVSVIVDDYGGRLEYERRSGGNRITVYLPRGTSDGINAA